MTVLNRILVDGGSYLSRIFLSFLTLLSGFQFEFHFLCIPCPIGNRLAPKLVPPEMAERNARDWNYSILKRILQPAQGPSAPLAGRCKWFLQNFLSTRGLAFWSHRIICSPMLSVLTCACLSTGQLSTDTIRFTQGLSSWCQRWPWTYQASVKIPKTPSGQTLTASTKSKDET